MNVEVLIKNVYGKKCFYPVSQDAANLCKLIGRPTLTTKHLKICNQSGWKVNITSQQFTLAEFMSMEDDEDEVEFNG